MLANLKIRNKLLAALIPLGAMVLVAVSHATFNMFRADQRYTVIIDEDVKGVRSLTAARSLSNRFDFLLYKEMGESDPEAKRRTDAELDEVAIEFQRSIADALRETHLQSKAIRDVAAQFNEVVSSSRPVRTATLSGDNKSAMSLMQYQMDPRLDAVQVAMQDLIDAVDRSVDKESDGLTVEMQRSVAITWLVALIGLGGTIAFALYVVQLQVVQVLE